jgi:predicted nucleotidyltransferase
MAVMLHGADYLTSDCDLATEKTESNLANVKNALEELCARPVRASDDGPFEIDNSILMAPFMHLKTEAGPVDLINRLPGIDSFQGLFDRSIIVNVQGVEIRMASIEDLIRLKRDTNRERDKLHVSMLETLAKLANPKADL